MEENKKTKHEMLRKLMHGKPSEDDYTLIKILNELKAIRQLLEQRQ